MSNEILIVYNKINLEKHCGDKTFIAYSIRPLYAVKKNCNYELQDIRFIDSGFYM